MAGHGREEGLDEQALDLRQLTAHGHRRRQALGGDLGLLGAGRQQQDGVVGGKGDGHGELPFVIS
jgi:hypothetical protein